MTTDGILTGKNKIKVNISGMSMICLVQIYFFVRYLNSDYNPWLVIALMLSFTLQLIAIIILHRDVYHYFAATLACCSSYIFVALLVGLSGGMDAPGVYWVSIGPLIFGTFLNRKIGLYTLPLVLLVLALYFFIPELFPLPERFQPSDKYFNAKAINLTVFTGFIFAFMYFYHNALEKSQTEIRNKTQQLDTLLRILVHDIANDLQVAEYHTSMINEKKEYDEKRINRTLNSILNTKELILKIRTWSSLNYGKMRTELQALEILPLIEESLLSFEDKCNHKNINLIRDFQITDEKIYVDSTIFKMQILNNLLSNAIKFTPESGNIKIKARVKNGDTLDLRIKDNGIGIPKHLLPKLFEMDQATTRRGTSGEKGTGFGLPLVKEFTENLNGSIEVKSIAKDDHNDSKDHGTEFILLIPLAINMN